MSLEIFVFGSNLAGIHGAGAALYARKYQGAVMGRGIGHHGDSYGIPTKDIQLRTLSLESIKDFVQQFIWYAHIRPGCTFKVTRIGCGLAGYTDAEIAPLFNGAPINCQFDLAWKPFLGDSYAYWGTKKTYPSEE